MEKGEYEIILFEFTNGNKYYIKEEDIKHPQHYKTGVLYYLNNDKVIHINKENICFSIQEKVNIYQIDAEDLSEIMQGKNINEL